MYAKLFASIYQGTMRGKPACLLVFTNLLAHADADGFVDIHPRAISDEVGLPLPEVAAALLELESPDPESRSPEEEGRRILRVDDHRAWGWLIVNHAKYKAIRDADERREQNRMAQARRRERMKQQSADVLTVSKRQQTSAESAHTDTDTDTKTLRVVGTTPDGFEAFWREWPKSDRKQAKAECRKKWQARKLDRVADQIVAHVRLMRGTDQWQRGFEPAPLTYINQRRWEDGETPASPMEGVL